MKIVSRGDKVRFKCKMCGSCCRRLLNLEITPYDIVTWWEQGRVDIIAHLVAIQDEVARSYGVPFIFTFPRRGDGSCIYLRDNLCTIHSVKPLACRIYPFGLGPNYELIVQEECKGVGEGDEVDLEKVIQLIKKHLAGIEALKIPEVQEKILDIVCDAKRRYLENTGCLENLERILRIDQPDYSQEYVFANIKRRVYMLYYGDIEELVLRRGDVDTLARWFAENSKNVEEAVSLIHLHSLDDKGEESCRGVVVLYSCDVDTCAEPLKRSLELINDLSVELVTIFLRT